MGATLLDFSCLTIYFQIKIVRNRFAKVVFGVTSSPFCLNGTIGKHVQNYDFDIEFIEKALLFSSC